MKDLIDIIKENALKNPKAVAVFDGNEKINYSNFLSLCNTISQNLKMINEMPKVVIDLHQSFEAYALIVAVLNVGGTFCPLNPNSPIERKNHVIREFNPDIVVVESENIDPLFKGKKVSSISRLMRSKNTVVPIFREYDPNSTAYIIYTSGSTGVPKGVMISRKALNKFLEWSIPTYNAGTGDIWGQFSLLSFDLSLVDIFTCLCSGATLLVLADPASKIRPSSIIEKGKMTIWHSVPSAIDFMIKSDESKKANFSSLKLMSFCGEPLKKYHLDFLFSKNKHLKVFNTYGPTEGTLFCTWQELKSDDYLEYYTSTMSIGKPIPGWNLYLKPIEKIKEKEIVIYGDYIGKGYIGEPHQNNFKKLNISGKRFSVFETGDLITEEGGNLYFSCRKDRQVKVMGHRIELNEIDVWNRQFFNKPSVSINIDNALYSFIETEKTIDESEIREFLSKKLETYKIPRAFFAIKEIPRNDNLKVNTKALIGLIP